MHLATSPHEQDVTEDQFLKRSLTGLNKEFSFSGVCSHKKINESSLSYYLPTAGRRIIGYLIQRLFVPCEMRTVLSRIWTRFPEPISYDNNHNSTSASSDKYRMCSAIKRFIHNTMYRLVISTLMIKKKYVISTKMELVRGFAFIS